MGNLLLPKKKNKQVDKFWGLFPVVRVLCKTECSRHWHS